MIYHIDRSCSPKSVDCFNVSALDKSIVKMTNPALDLASQIKLCRSHKICERLETIDIVDSNKIALNGGIINSINFSILSESVPRVELKISIHSSLLKIIEYTARLSVESNKRKALEIA